MARDTIAAIATPPGEGGIGVIRISGSQAVAILQQLTHFEAPPKPRYAYLRDLGEPDDVLDQAVVIAFYGPHSFTGEDTVEISCHGGRITLQRVLEAVFAHGARLAEAGEFSRRALENGRLDLVQVEAIADVIHAESVDAHRLAQRHLAGRLSEALGRIREPLFELVALVEAAIDFSTEEHVYTITPAQIEAKAEPIIGDLQALLRTYDDGRMRHQGVRLAIIGPPNAGKSSLLNYLLSEERAIVTDIEGTTRDYIEEDCIIRGVHFRLVDTAGLRDTEDKVEAIGVAQSRKLARDADVLLVVGDASRAEQLQPILEELGERRYGVLWNKMDLVDRPPAATDRPFCAVSLKTGARLDELERFLLSLAEQAGFRQTAGSALITRARHQETLQDAVEHLEQALDAARMGLDHTFIALDLRAALDKVASMTGAITSDDILNKIFDGFCIGK